ncbi:hypothetical protein [Moraxella bovoculi]|uniref:hypothetical protein n=1 Tax=Moraxella bovoculi TaxID=386891 RepID=UPI00072F4AB5|nr:hypothetical protein [Moraxella bovoculi]AKG15979.2 hypothetical protein AAX08_08815 [Moraxella bovoculi]AKG18042.2 hypothetical protein AAX10_08450 [Moraxella bovoculi]
MDGRIIISKNPYADISEFKELLKRVDQYLNNDALIHEQYYRGRSDTLLEQDVFKSLELCSKGTPFESSIELVSGKKFPDIVACGYYGIEVKSTTGDKWVSLGGSILESTRVQGVERIFITFGKLGGDIKFISRPYEDCMETISVTHYPRYKINMTLQSGETIFDKMKISYDDLRNMENPIKPVADYLKQGLPKGKRLWWADYKDEDGHPPVLSLWTKLTQEEKRKYTAMAFALYPEILGNRNDKYHDLSLWLVTNYSVVNNNIRDTFSAGGMVEVNQIRLPAVFGKMRDHKELIQKILNEFSSECLAGFWGVSVIENDRLAQWIRLCAEYASESGGKDKDEYLNVLKFIFS